MLAVVESGTIKSDKILVVVSTTHVDACRPVACRLHARQLLQRFHHVHLAQHHRHLFDLCGGKCHSRHLRRLHAKVAARAVDIDVAQLRAALQSYLYCFFPTFCFERRRRVANVCCGKLCLLGNIYLKISSHISRCACT